MHFRFTKERLNKIGVSYISPLRCYFRKVAEMCKEKFPKSLLEQM
jgi:hypothetical protein